MFQSFFTGLSGMVSFSRSLDNVSNNIANMNTPGYRGQDVFLRSLSDSNDSGLGTSVEGSSTRLTPGEVRQTGNNTDVAITGRGMFTLRDDNGELYYSRAGQFQFDDDNILVDSVTGMNVLGISESGNLEIIDISESRILPAIASSEVQFIGNLSSTDTNHEVSPVTVFDASGVSHDLTLNFSNSASSVDTWNVEVLDIRGNTVGTGEVRFDSTGSPLADFNSFDITTDFSGTSQTISFNFGEAGSLSGATQFTGSTSTLGTSEINGNGVLGLVNITFDDKGIIQLEYSNGETEEGQTLAIASFTNEGNLELTSGNLYQNDNQQKVSYSQADTNGLGKVQGGSLELSNVDLTQEFADILVIQRGYQASSQIMSVANELIEQLYSSTRG